MSRRLRRLLLAGVALALVVAAALVLGLFPQDPLRRLAERRLAAALGARVQVERLRVVPGGLRVHAEGVVVESPTFQMKVRSADLILNRAALGGALSLARLEAYGVQLLLAPSPTRAPSASLPPIRVDALTLRDAAVVYTSSELGTLRLEGIAAQGAIGSGTLELTLAQGTLERPRPVRFEGRARLALGSDLDTKVEELRLATLRSTIQARGSLGPLTAPRPELELEGSADLAEASELAELGEMAGTVSLEARIASRIEVHAEGRELRVAGQRLSTAAVAIQHDAKATTFRGSASLLGGGLDGDGRLVEGRLSSRVRFRSLELAPLARASGEATLAGDPAGTLQLTATFATSGSQDGTTLRGTGEVRGSLSAASRRLDLEWSLLADGEAARVPQLAVDAQGTLQGPWPSAIVGSAAGRALVEGPSGPLELSFDGGIQGRGSDLGVELRGSGAGGALAARIQISGGAVARLSAEGRGLDLARLVPQAAGLGTLRADLRDPFGRPTGDASLELGGLVYSGEALGDATLTARFDGGRADAVVLAPALKLRAEATLPAGQGRPLEGVVELDDTPLDRLAAALGRPELTGRADGRARFSVPLEAPGEGTLALERLELERPGTRLAVSGTLGLRADAPLSLSVEGTADLAAAPAPEGYALSGRAGATARVTGTPRAPVVEGTFQLDGLSADGPRLPPLAVASALVRFERDRIVLPQPVQVQVAGGHISLSGEVPLAALSTRLRGGALSGAQGLRLHVVWSGLDATALRSESASAAAWAATVSGEADIQGGLASFAEPKVAASVTLSDVRAGELEIGVAPFELRLERGRLSSPRVELAAAGATLVASGFHDLVSGDRELHAAGKLDLRALAPLVAGMSLGGTATLDVRYGAQGGTPRASGTIEVTDATLRLEALPQSITSLNARLTLDNDGLRLSEASALLGGGTLTAGGGVSLRGGAAQVDVTLTGRDITLRYPEGMRSRVAADLRLSGTPAALRLEGDARVQGGFFDLDTLVTGKKPPPRQPSAALRRITLDVRVTTDEPILVRNTLARIEATAQLSFRGDLDVPEPYGRVELAPGGRVKLTSRDFRLESGVVTYQGDWNAALNIRASGRVRNAEERRDYDVTVSLGGTTDNAALHFSSDPPESEARIASLVTTGHFGAAGYESAGLALGDQLAGLFATRLTRGLAGGLGLDEISIQPELISRETDPGARFTFGKQISERVRLIQSWSLNDPEGRFTQLEGTPGRDVTVIAQRNDDGSYTGGVGQRLRFGGEPWRAGRAEERVAVAGVEFVGSPPSLEAGLRRRFGVEAGDRVTRSSLQDKADELREHLLQAGRIEAEVGARLVEGQAVVNVSAGPLVAWSVVGAAKPGDFDQRLRESLSVEGALETGRDLLLAQEQRSGRLRAEVTASQREEDGRRLLSFEVRPGSVQSARIEFAGASGLSHEELLAAAGGPAALLTAPEAAAARLREAYHNAFFLSAEVDPPRVLEQGSQVSITVPIREGQRARIREVHVRGSTLADAVARRALRLRPGREYDEERAAAAGVRLRIKELEAGYPDARVARSIQVAGGDVDVSFDVRPGEKVMIGAIEIEGARRTRLPLVEDQLRLEPGDALDVRALTRAEQRLLDLGAFRRALVTWTRESPAKVNVALTEDARLITGYEARYNDEEGGSLQLDAEIKHLFGRAVSLGGRYRLGTTENELRSSLHIPSAFRIGDLVLSAFRSYEELETLAEEPDVRRERGAQIQQAVRLSNRWNVLYGYRFRRVTIESPFFPEPITEKIAALEASVVREGRDNPINARRGHFLSFSLERGGLGSDFKFLKTLTQGFFNQRLNRHLTWSQGYRLGLAWGRQGQDVVSSERFQAGGANTMRPFAEDSLGPRNVLGQVTGGEGLLIFNQELRVNHSSGLGAAIFYDAGNVFERVQDIGFDLRHGAGVGVRYDSPIGLLRLDVGFPFARKPGEDAYQVYFSLGQAF